MPVFFVCAGLLGLLAVSLTVSVGRLRMQKKIYLGDGGDPEMLAAIRAHGNFMEYVPLCLALIYFASDYYGYWPVAIAVADPADLARAARRRPAGLHSARPHDRRGRHDDHSRGRPRPCASMRASP